MSDPSVLTGSNLRAIVLDTGPLGLASNPAPTAQSDACNRWIERQVQRQVRVIVPEVADYELRRELLRAGKIRGIARLEMLTASLSYLPLDTAMMRQAATFWAQARNANRQTADPHSLDADVILAAQTLSLGLPAAERGVVVATTNPAHLSQFVLAYRWQEIE